MRRFSSSYPHLVTNADSDCRGGGVPADHQISDMQFNLIPSQHTFQPRNQSKVYMMTPTPAPPVAAVSSGLPLQGFNHYFQVSTAPPSNTTVPSAHCVSTPVQTFRGANDKMIYQRRQIIPGSATYQEPIVSISKMSNVKSEQPEYPTFNKHDNKISSSHAIYAKKDTLDPKAPEYNPIPINALENLSVRAPEFKPSNAGPSSQAPRTYHTERDVVTQNNLVNQHQVQARSSIIHYRPSQSFSSGIFVASPLASQSPREIRSVSSATIKRAAQMSLYNFPNQAASIVKNESAQSHMETQTTLTGENLDSKLCNKCKDVLLGQSPSVKPDAPGFITVKDISMQHKLRYLSMKAAMFVRESPSILTKPEELKSKIQSRLNKICTSFGAELSESTAWQDDIACSIAVNLLTEEPDLSSIHNNTKFLQQLKGELDSHMEIAQLILNQENENPEKKSIAREMKDANDIVTSSDKQWYEYKGEIPPSTIGACIKAEASLIPEETYMNQIMSQMGHMASNTYSNTRSNITTGMVKDLRHDNPSYMSNYNILTGLSNSNCQTASLPDNSASISDSGDASNNQLYDALNKTTTSQNMQEMQQNYLGLLTQLDLLKQHQQPLSVVMNPFKEQLSSDEFVSAISQESVQHGKLDPFNNISPELSPSMSLDDGVSVALSVSSEGHVRHSSGNSDSEKHTMKKKQPVSLGSKKLPPLDFRANKVITTKSNSETQNDDTCNPVENLDCNANFNFQLTALYNSVTSHIVTDEFRGSNSNSSKCPTDVESNTNMKLPMSSSVNVKPLRRLTPLQRKRLKMKEGSGQQDVQSVQVKPHWPQTLPEASEVDEELSLKKTSVHILPDNIFHIKDQLSMTCYNDISNTKCSDLSTERGNQCQQRLKELLVTASSPTPEITSDVVKDKQDKEFCHISHISETSNETKLNAIGRTLSHDMLYDVENQSYQRNALQDSTPVLGNKESVFKEQNSRNNSCEEINIFTSDIKQINSMRNDDMQLTSAGVESKLTKIDKDSQQGNDVDSKHSFISLESTNNSASLIPLSPAKVPLLDDSMFSSGIGKLELNEEYDWFTMSYSNAVKRHHTSGTDNINNSQKPPLCCNDNDSFPSLSGNENVDNHFETSNKVENQELTLSTNTSSSCHRTWSSLFNSSKNVNAAKQSVCKDYTEKSERTDIMAACSQPESESQSEIDSQMLSKYGLDDFTNTPTSLKHRSKSFCDDDRDDGDQAEEAEEEFPFGWQVVKKKSKKRGECQDIGVMLQNFRTDDYYAELCKVITDKYERLSLQSIKDVLETVFVETDGMYELKRDDVLAEVDVALTEMSLCAGKSCEREQSKAKGSESSDVNTENDILETSSISQSSSDSGCPFQ